MNITPSPANPDAISITSIIDISIKASTNPLTEYENAISDANADKLTLTPLSARVAETKAVNMNPRPNTPTFISS